MHHQADDQSDLQMQKFLHAYDEVDYREYLDTCVLSERMYIRYVTYFSAVSVAIEFVRCKPKKDCVLETFVLLERDWSNLKTKFTEMKQIILSKADGCIKILPNDMFTDTAITLRHTMQHGHPGGMRNVEINIHRSADDREDSFVLTAAEWVTLEARQGVIDYQVAEQRAAFNAEPFPSPNDPRNEEQYDEDGDVIPPPPVGHVREWRWRFYTMTSPRCYSTRSFVKYAECEYDYQYESTRIQVIYGGGIFSDIYFEDILTPA